MAIGSMHAAYKRKILIPRELSIVGSEDIRFAENTLPPLTTAAIPRSDIGRLAFHALHTMVGLISAFRALNRSPVSEANDL